MPLSSDYCLHRLEFNTGPVITADLMDAGGIGHTFHELMWGLHCAEMALALLITSITASVRDPVSALVRGLFI